MFLHSGFIHLALNMLSLYFLGSFVEQAFGKSRFLALYLCSGLAGGIAYLYFGAFDTPAVGASGAIFGLLGGVFGYSVRRGTFSWQNPLIRQLLILTALNLYIGFSVPNISNTAHIGGLVGGAAFGWLTAPTVYSGKPLRAATPTVILFGAELILLALWLSSLEHGASSLSGRFANRPHLSAGQLHRSLRATMHRYQRPWVLRRWRGTCN